MVVCGILLAAGPVSVLHQRELDEMQPVFIPPKRFFKPFLFDEGAIALGVLLVCGGGVMVYVTRNSGRVVTIDLRNDPNGRR